MNHLLCHIGLHDYKSELVLVHCDHHWRKIPPAKNGHQRKKTIIRPGEPPPATHVGTLYNGDQCVAESYEICKGCEKKRTRYLNQPKPREWEDEGKLPDGN